MINTKKNRYEWWKRTEIAVFFLLVCCSVMAAKVKKATEPYRRADLPVEERMKDLLSRMTLEEKIMQLNQYIIGMNLNDNNAGYHDEEVPGTIGSVINFCGHPGERNALQREAMKTRLGIPVLFGFDVIHGFRTVYPIPLAMGCSWNPGLIESVAHMAASETRQSGSEWVFSPMLDITHDPRWGRVSEGFGEDPYLVSVLGAAEVRGYQGTNLNSNDRVAACLKHFVGYGCSEGGRDYTATQISDQRMWETYLPPFEAAVSAGAPTAMSAFNDINGIPATANHHYLKEILKDRFGMTGFVVSDWSAVVQLITQGYAADRKEAARLAINAGMDMDMIGNCFRHHLTELVQEGQVKMETIDEAVGRILRVKFELGLFEHPYTKVVPEKERVLKPEYKALAAQMAEESMVLLKNEKQTLPLRNKGKIALIGPMVKDRHEIIGSWRCFGKDEDAQTLYEGMKGEFDNAELLYARGCDFDSLDRSGFDEARRIAEQADVVVLMLGEKAAWSGENASRASIALPAIQEELAHVIAQTGKPIVLVLSAGRPTELVRLEPLCNAILEIWQPGICGGTPMAGILSGRLNPSGRLDITFPLDTRQIPIYYNARQSSRPTQGQYQDMPSKPLYEFGYGLSYTTYDYSSIQVGSEVSSHVADINSITMHRGDKLRLTINVTNSGDMDGMETVQWYVCDPVCRVTRPLKELRHFEKRLIRKGETEKFTLDLTADEHLSYVDAQGNRFVESGDYYIMVKDKTININLQN